jgi:ISXO2-like transposase domain
VKLAEHLGLGQKTAWFVGQRIRRMMADQDHLLRGVVEVDETYFGGKRRKRATSRCDPDDQPPTGRGGSRRKMVMVATERGGRARAAKGDTHSERTIVQFILGNRDVQGRGGRIVLCTGALPAYRWIGSKFPAHLRGNHSARAYIRRDPGYAADAKRAIIGVWHWFSIKHTDRDRHELCSRWNRRKASIETRLSHILAGAAIRRRWRELVA